MKLNRLNTYHVQPQNPLFTSDSQHPPRSRHAVHLGDVAEQARKALFLLYSRINNLNLPVDLQLKLFDHTVLPIMTYSCEVFGFENIQILERIHNEFLRKITKTKKSTPLFMLYAELGRYPIEIIIKSRMISFWNRIITGKQSKYSYQLYQAVRFAIPQKSKWLRSIRNILTETGIFDLWLNQDYIQSRNVGRLIKQVLIDQNLQKWHAGIAKGPKLQVIQTIYRLLNFEQQITSSQSKREGGKALTWPNENVNSALQMTYVTNFICFLSALISQSPEKSILSSTITLEPMF